MKQGRKETITTRIISTTFMVVALAVFKPFGLEAWQWQAYVHLAAFWVIGFSICIVDRYHPERSPQIELRASSYEANTNYIRAFCFSPAPLPRYFERASLNFQVRSSMKVRRAGLLVVNSRIP